MRTLVRLVLVLALAFCCVALSQPPVSSSLGQLPTPPAGGTAADPAAGDEAGSPMGEFEVWKWSVQQGGLTVVCLVLVAVLYRELRSTRGDKRLLVELVEKNTAAHVAAADTNGRLARALETKGIL